MSSNQKRGKQVRYITVSISVSCAKLLLSIADIANAWSFTTNYIQKVTPVIDIEFPKESGKK